MQFTNIINTKERQDQTSLQILQTQRITKEYYGKHYFPTKLGKMDKFLERHNLSNLTKKYKTSKDTYQLKELNQ